MGEIRKGKETEENGERRLERKSERERKGMVGGERGRV